MIFEERKVELVKLLTAEETTMGDYAVIKPFKIPAAKVMFNGEEIETPEFETPETKLYFIKGDNEERELLFDNALFPMAIAPCKKGKEICFKNSFLNKYLKKVFLPAFLEAEGKQEESFKIKCGLLTKEEVFGKTQEDESGMLTWFYEPKHRIAIYKKYPVWWWLEDYIERDGDVVSAPRFAFVYGGGSVACAGAGGARTCVRPRFTIRTKAKPE